MSSVGPHTTRHFNIHVRLQRLPNPTNTDAASNRMGRTQTPCSNNARSASKITAHVSRMTDFSDIHAAQEQLFCLPQPTVSQSWWKLFLKNNITLQWDTRFKVRVRVYGTSFRNDSQQGMNEFRASCHDRLVLKLLVIAMIFRVYPMNAEIRNCYFVIRTKTNDLLPKDLFQNGVGEWLTDVILNNVDII